MLRRICDIQDYRSTLSSGFSWYTLYRLLRVAGNTQLLDRVPGGGRRLEGWVSSDTNSMGCHEWPRRRCQAATRGQGRDRFERQYSKWTPLSLVAWAGNETIVKQLLKAQAATDLKDDRGCTPLFL